jgi:hypothetical protein
MIIVKKLLKRPTSSMLKETSIYVDLHSFCLCKVFKIEGSARVRELIYHIL